MLTINPNHITPEKLYVIQDGIEYANIMATIHLNGIKFTTQHEKHCNQLIAIKKGYTVPGYEGKQYFVLYNADADTIEDD